MDKRLSGVKPRDCIFRIYKDVRFSKDKSPYKTNFGAYIRPGGRKTHSAGYYIHIEHGKSMIGTGIYKPEAIELSLIRAHIAANGKDLEKAMQKAEFKKYFSDLYDDALKKVPRGYDPGHTMGKYLKYKSLIVSNIFQIKKFFPANF
ncbi:MAG: DUF2461 domain-containing protein [Spirochaetia bacterium]|nr:DUF2461 domain-containing protein [Spirochaetia bacterium]